MTSLERQHAASARPDGTKRLVASIAFILVGLIAGFAIGQSRLGFVAESERTIAVGPLVERSHAMQANIEALIEGGQAQAEALAAVNNSYVGPLVIRSLAMDRFYGSESVVYSGPLVVRSLAMDRFYGSESVVYSGPLVDRSLAMQRQLAALVESARAQATALGIEDK